MRLLLRHFRKSILGAPKESLVILLTVFLSALLFFAASGIYTAIGEENEKKYVAAYGEADLSVEGLTEHGTRFVNTDALAALGADCRAVCGVLSLPFSSEWGQGTAAATDLAAGQAIFSFSFAEITAVREDALTDAVYLSREYAAAAGVGLGDRVTLTLLGQACSFTVYGIHETVFLDRCDILFDSSRALRILEQSSPAFAVFDRENMPATTLFVSLAEGVSVEEAVARINGSAAGQDAYAAAIEFEENGYVRRLQTTMLWMVLLCTAVMAAAFVLFSLRIISEKRQGETEAFLLVGVRPRTLFWLFAGEVSVYLAVGTGAAVGVSAVIFPTLFRGLFRYASPTLRLEVVLVGLLCEGLVGVASLLAYRYLPAGGRRRSAGRGHPRLLLLSLALTVAGGAVAPFLPPRARLFAGFYLLFTLLATLFCGMPLFLSLLSRWLLRARAEFSLASKNNARLPEMRYLHTALAAVLAVAVIPLATLWFYTGYIDNCESRLQAGYLISGVGEEVAEQVEALEGTAAVTPFFLAESRPSAAAGILMLVSAEDPAFLTDLAGGSLPRGNEILLCPTTARLLGVSIGDSLVMPIHKQEYTFVVSGFVSVNQCFAYINARDMGFPSRMLLVNAAPEAGEAYLSRLAATGAFYGGFAAPTDSLLSHSTEPFLLFARILKIYLSATFLLAAIGCANLIYVGYARRRPQLRVLALAGMSARERRRMVAAEGGMLTATALLFGALFGAALLYALEQVLASYGFSLRF